MFSYINKTEDLILPKLLPKLMKNTLINDSELYKFQQLLLYNYSSLSQYILPSKEKYIKVPYIITAKYFLYLYTCESQFYRDMNRILTNDDKKEIYLQFINILLYSIYNKGFKSLSSDELYRGGSMKRSDFKKLKNYLIKRKIIKIIMK